MQAADLIAFEADIAREFDAGNIHAPVHLNSDTQAEPLIEIFKEIKPTDRMQVVVLYERTDPVWHHASCVRLARLKKRPLRVAEAPT